jgi:hypothetical protein
LSEGGIACWDAKTGQRLWLQETDDGFYASPIVAGDQVFLMDRAGKMFIFEANGAAFTALAQPVLGEEAATTPAVYGESLIYRGAKHLYRIGFYDPLRSPILSMHIRRWANRGRVRSGRDGRAHRVQAEHLIPLLQAMQTRWSGCRRRWATLRDHRDQARRHRCLDILSSLRHEPAGRHIIKTCIGTACTSAARRHSAARFAAAEAPPGQHTDSAGLPSNGSPAWAAACSRPSCRLTT